MNNMLCFAIARAQSSLLSLVLERISSVVLMRPFVTQSISLSNIMPAACAAVRPEAVELIHLLKGRSPSRRKPGLRKPAFEQSRRSGGADRDRTGDPLLAKQVLSQLSYSPVSMVGLGRFELPTSPLSGVRSNQLSYRPE
jgi:hypothetical protein